ncbi:MAG: 50S ribosomal protein L24 [Candidatus Brocadiia bacterium]
MNTKLHVRTDDMVEVIAGDYRGARGRVLRALPRDGKVVVEGVNLIWKHVKPTQENPRGGRVEREAPIHVSNVMLICQNRDCDHYDQPVRIRNDRDENGVRKRICAKCGASIASAE